MNFYGRILFDQSRKEETRIQSGFVRYMLHLKFEEKRDKGAKILLSSFKNLL